MVRGSSQIEAPFCGDHLPLRQETWGYPGKKVIPLTQ